MLKITFLINELILESFERIWFASEVISVRENSVEDLSKDTCERRS
jgi:hypothetical protein